VWSTYLDEPFVSWVVEVPGGGGWRRLAPAGRAMRALLLSARRLAGQRG
jgi:hypothetical protein